jgi:hypothetical protein
MKGAEAHSPQMRGQRHNVVDVWLHVEKRVAAPASLAVPLS